MKERFLEGGVLRVEEEVQKGVEGEEGVLQDVRFITILQSDGGIQPSGYSDILGCLTATTNEQVPN